MTADNVSCSKIILVQSLKGTSPVSQQAVANFVRQVENDAALRDKLSDLALDDMPGILKVAASAGYIFTADAYLAYWRTAARTRTTYTGSEMLSDAELSSVAGGQMASTQNLTCCMQGTKWRNFGY